jgi:cell division protein FtsW (lipid II flippase)
MTSIVLALLQTVTQSASSTGSTTPRRLAFIPEQHTDFVFAVVREDFSIVTLAVVMLLLFTLTFVLRRRRARGKKKPSGE